MRGKTISEVLPYRAPVAEPAEPAAVEPATVEAVTEVEETA